MTEGLQILLLVHFFSTVFMTGLCWFVQIVHYPLFKAVRSEDLPQYERKNKVTGYITVPVMLVELFSGLFLAYHFWELPHILNLAFLGIIWLSTAVYQVPMHLKLMQAAHADTLNKLIQTNWIRTISWSIRSIIICQILWQLLST